MASISVCIPTYKRPRYLKEAVHSAIHQDLKPFEIIIGDDSPDDETENIVGSIDPQGVTIRYYRNRPSLGQARNVQSLIQRSKGDIVALLHDDDRFHPNAFRALAEPFENHSEVVACFGKQIIISDDGTENPELTRHINPAFDRTPDRAGLVRNSVEAGALQMFPNAGYFVRGDVARQIDYYDNNYASRACDYYYGLRLGLLERPFYFIDRFTYEYRLSDLSSSRSVKDPTHFTDSGFYLFKAMSEKLRPEQITPAIARRMRQNVKFAISIGVLVDRKTAWKWFFSKWHASDIFTIGGLLRFVKLVIPGNMFQFIRRHRKHMGFLQNKD